MQFKAHAHIPYGHKFTGRKTSFLVNLDEILYGTSGYHHLSSVHKKPCQVWRLFADFYFWFVFFGIMGMPNAPSLWCQRVYLLGFQNPTNVSLASMQTFRANCYLEIMLNSRHTSHSLLTPSLHCHPTPDFNCHHYKSLTATLQKPITLSLTTTSPINPTLTPDCHFTNPHTPECH